MQYEWRSFGDYVRQAREQPGFRRFVLEHLPDFGSEDAYLRVAGRAATSCPSGAEKECAEVRAAALEGAENAREDGR